MTKEKCQKQGERCREESDRAKGGATVQRKRNTEHPIILNKRVQYPSNKQKKKLHAPQCPLLLLDLQPCNCVLEGLLTQPCRRDFDTPPLHPLSFNFLLGHTVAP